MNKESSLLVFDSGKNKYIFDNISGNIIVYNDIEKYIIDNYFKVEKEQLIDSVYDKYRINKKEIINHYNYVKSLIDSGCFYSNVDLTDINFEEAVNKRPMSQLILILTEQCNLRCKYCVYSEHYPNIMEYSDASMNIETAKKAIDEYMELHKIKQRNGYRKKAIISFYGGEPFLKFDLIKEIIEYCSIKGYDVRYYATTNGTIMNEEIIKCVTENDFVLTFSLDGHKEQHDRNRVFTKDAGSFDKVYENILMLQNYKKNRNITQPISINCTYDEYSNFEKIANFFIDNYNKFEPFYVMFGKVNKLDNSYYDYCDKEFEKGNICESKENSIETYKNLLNFFRNKRINDNELRILKAFFAPLYITSKRVKGLMGIWGGVCFPSNKIAVSPKGEYFVCERINQQFKIGDIENGLDMKRCAELFNKFLDIVKVECKQCNVSRMCERCYIHYVKDEENLNFNMDLCEERKQNIPNLLGTLCSILEINPNLFDLCIDVEGENSIMELYQVMG